MLEPEQMIALRIAKAGYYKGDPGEVMNAPVTTVLDIFYYELFLSELEDVTYEMNRPTS